MLERKHTGCPKLFLPGIGISSVVCIQKNSIMFSWTPSCIIAFLNHYLIYLENYLKAIKCSFYVYKIVQIDWHNYLNILRPKNMAILRFFIWFLCLIFFYLSDTLLFIIFYHSEHRRVRQWQKIQEMWSKKQKKDQ